MEIRVRFYLVQAKIAKHIERGVACVPGEIILRQVLGTCAPTDSAMQAFARRPIIDLERNIVIYTTHETIKK